MKKSTIRAAVMMVALVCMSGAVAGSASAEEEGSDSVTRSPFRLNEVVVTADRTAQDNRQSGSSITVITAEDVEKRHVNSVLELLRDVPGVVVTTSGGLGTATSIRIRGANDVHTLVLLDGVRIHSNTLGSAQLQNLTTDNIDRIEIVRGPQSTLYGSDAMGGVIQIFTKKGTGNHSSISYEGGSFNTNQVRVATTTSSERQSISLAGSWLELDGYSRFNERRGAIENDGDRNKTASVSYRSALPLFDVGVNLRYSDGKIDIDPSTKDNTSQFSRSRDYVLALDLSRELGEHWMHTATLTGFQDDLEGNTGSDFRIISTTRAAKWQSELRLNGGHKIIGGFESEQLSGENRGFFSKSTINNAVYLEGIFNYHDLLYLTLGGRNDNHSAFGDHSTWRATATYNGFQNTRLFSSFGTGFKAPTFNQLYYPGIGNATLQPEESQGWDAGIEHLFAERFLLTATYFENRFENLIEFAAPTFVAVNTSRAATNGMEFSGKLSITDHLALDAQYTYLEARDDISHLRLQRRPRNIVSAHLGYNPTPSWAFDVYYRNVGPSFSATGEKNRVDGFDLLAAAISYTWRDRHKFWVRGENLLDTEYEEVFDFGTPGASFYGGYELRF